VIFSGESYTQFPITTEHAGLLEQINALRSGMLVDGTVIGEGLATSVERLSASKNRTRVIILLTDGNEQPPDTRMIDPITALEIARTKGVKVYTIGMGALGGIAVAEKGVARSGGGSFLDESLLKRIANGTGGQYFRATDKESLEEIYRQIDRLEKSAVEVINKTRFEEMFLYFVLAALFFLAMDLILRFTYLRTFP
jgi:Ca-activated chloride channel family protein